MTDTDINESVARKLGHEPIECGDECRCIADLNIKDYSTSIEAAWEIVEKIKNIYALQAVFTLVYDTADLEWNCTAGGVCGRSDTAPMAICLAFLKLP